jgi:protein-disulfide isomerase
MAKQNTSQKRISKKVQRQEERAREVKMQSVRYGGLATIIIIAIAGFIFWRNSGQLAAEDVPPLLDGLVSAPVRIVEYGDLGCSACRSWHNAGIKQQLKDAFGDQIAFEYRHYPVITAYSPDAAEGAQCAAEQDSFWAFHDYIYENLSEYPPLDRPSLKTYATSVGIDRELFDACLDSRKYESVVFNDAQQARAAGARGTPTFLVNGELVPLPSFENLSSLIRAELGS